MTHDQDEAPTSQVEDRSSEDTVIDNHNNQEVNDATTTN